MPLLVVCFSTYRTSVVTRWTSDEYDAHDFIDAIKNRNINKYANVKLRGKWNYFDNNNRQDVVSWFATMIADYLAAHPIDTPIVFVSVPGSKVDVNFAGIPRTAQLAAAIVAAINDDDVTAADVLRWEEPIPSANEQGGTRDPAELFDHLLVIDDVDGWRVVLVDDVLTSGGHLQACAAKLRGAGAEVLMAVVAGRADANQVDDPFAIRSEEIADYDP